MLKKFTTDGGNTMRLKDLVSAIRSGEYIYPAAQRAYSYTTYKEQNLITSILMGIPIDTISLILMPDDHYLIADGMHRCTAICRFADSKFSLPDKPQQDLYMRDCLMTDDEFTDVLNLEDYGCEELYGKSYNDVKRTFNEYRVNTCVFKPARPEDVNDVVVSIMKIKNKSTNSMPVSRILLVPTLYNNPKFGKFWNNIVDSLSENDTADSIKNKRINTSWFSDFFNKCFKNLKFSDNELSQFANNIIKSGNTEELKYNIWKALFALHGHSLSTNDVKQFVKNEAYHCDNSFKFVFNNLIDLTKDRIWSPFKKLKS